MSYLAIKNNNGGYEISAEYNGVYYHPKFYIGYNKKDAIKEFRKNCGLVNKKIPVLKNNFKNLFDAMIAYNNIK